MKRTFTRDALYRGDDDDDDFPNQAKTINDKAVFPMETIFYVFSVRTTQ